MVGGDGQAAQHGWPGCAVARQRLDGGELAHVQVFARRPVAALDAAFDKGRQAGNHLRAHGIGQGEGLAQLAGLVRGGQQPGRQAVAAARGVHALRREIVGQAVVVQVGRQARHRLLPQLLVAQADGLAHRLLQAAGGVAREPVAHAGQALGQPGLQRNLQAAALVARGG